jgi:beta-glucosidase-like glycosyl hydrolase
MTLAEKAGQMMQPDRGMLRPGDLQAAAFGSLLSGGGSAPADNTPLGWARMITEFRQQSLATRLGIPLLYGVDAVHGHNNVPDAVIFPHNIGLGASRDPDLVTRIGRATAIELAATGVDWTFAPVVGSARDERWGRTYEAFGEAPELAELLGPALIRGLQGRRLGERPDSVLACAKHFLGDGHTEHGKDQGDSPLTPEQIESEVLPAYQRAIEAGVGSIMVSFSSVGDVKMHCHGPLLNDTLKSRLGFGGFLVSDWRAVEQLPGDYDAQLVSAINAGIDMIMAPAVYTGFLTTLQRLVPKRIPIERIDDAVARILAAKCALGRLEPNPFPTSSGWARPSTGSSRARPCRSRWCCCKTSAACCRSRSRCGAFTSPAVTRTIWAFNAAAGPSAGKGSRVLSRAAPRCARPCRPPHLPPASATRSMAATPPGPTSPSSRSASDPTPRAVATTPGSSCPPSRSRWCAG